MSVLSREVRLKSRPAATPSLENFELAERQLEPPARDQLLVRNSWMSVDPYMRGRMNAGKSYIEPFKVGEALEGAAIGVVERSSTPQFAPGDVVSHFSGWRDFAVIPVAAAQKIDLSVAPARAYLGPLGIPGFTAYIGLTRIAQAQPSDTVFVSAAAGAVGSMACQIAKLLGCRVVGSAGSRAKTAWLQDELQVDAAINYKLTDITKCLAEACPTGLDVYFDNVGGDHLEAALRVANDFARFALCGMISVYNSDTPPAGPPSIFSVVVKRITMKGFIITDHTAAREEFVRTVGRWVAAGNIRWRETVLEGLENAPEAFLGLFRGGNIGKALVRLA